MEYPNYQIHGETDDGVIYQLDNKKYYTKFLNFKDQKLQQFFISLERSKLNLSVLFFPPAITTVVKGYASLLQYQKNSNPLTFLTGAWTLFLQIVIGIMLLVLIIRERNKRIWRLIRFKYELELLFLFESLYTLGLNTTFSFGFALTIYFPPCKPNQFLLAYSCPETSSNSEHITNLIYIFLTVLYPIIVLSIFKSVNWTVLFLCWLFNVMVAISYFLIVDKSAISFICCISSIFVSFWYLYESRRQSISSFIHLWRLNERIEEYEKITREENKFNRIKESFNTISEDLVKVLNIILISI